MSDLQILCLTIALVAGVCALLGAAEWVSTRLLDMLEERARRRHHAFMCNRYLGVNGRPHD